MVSLKTIAHICSDFPTKFGIPRQSGLVQELESIIVFEPNYRNPDALRGLDTFSHLWLIWGFSEAKQVAWSPTVRPPRLGGNARLGVFATRSPYRPNPLGLSSVQIAHIALESDRGPIIHVRGADLMDKTPIYDIKPYIPYADSHPDAAGGFAGDAPTARLQVATPEHCLSALPEAKRKALIHILSLDPRPAYQRDPERVYGMGFAGFEVKFTVEANRLTVLAITEATD